MVVLYCVSQARRFVLIEGGDGVADRCVTQPFPAGGLGGAASPPAGSGAEPEANAFWQQSIENWLKIRSLGRRLHPNYSNFLENIISSSMYDTTSSGVTI